MDKSVNQLLYSLHAVGSAAGGSEFAQGLAPNLAMCSALNLPTSGEAPAWVHLLPAGAVIRTADGRGPYRLTDAQALVTASLQAGERLVLDENHSTDLAAPQGLSAPAMGWIVELQSRADGIWGKVEWTEDGKRLVAGRAYRGISPVIAHDKSGAIVAILRASLVNKPNLKGLTTLHQENDMTLLKRILEALGLPETTSEDNLVAAVTTMHQAQGQHQTALQAQLAPIGKAAGLTEGASVEAIVAAIGTMAAGGDGKTIVELQAELTNVTNRLNALTDDTARKAATDFVDGAIKAGRVGVKPLRDHYITRHMSDAASVVKEITALPALGGRMPMVDPSTPSSGLTAEQEAVIERMQLNRDDYLKTLQAEQARSGVQL